MSNVTVVSVVENRAREVCISMLDSQNLGTLAVTLITDNHNYSQTLSALRIICCDEILLHDGCKGRILSQKIIEIFSSDECRILFISRQYFDQDRGAEMLSKIMLPNSVDADLLKRYTVLAGSYCLLRYVENINNFMFAEKSLKIKHMNSKKQMHIDGKTAIDLELILNAQTGNEKQSLLGTMNHTRTIAGERLLRANILRPSLDHATISMRHDFVETMLQQNDIFLELYDALTELPNLEKMLSGVTISHNVLNAKTAKIGIDTLIYLKCALETTFSRLIPALEAVRNFISDENSSLVLLESFEHHLRTASSNELQSKLGDILHSSVEFSSSSEAMKHQECFALKTGGPHDNSRLHAMLSIARTSFLQCIEDIHQLANEYSELISLKLDEGESKPLLKVKHSSSRGYYLEIKPGNLSPRNLPDIFIQTIQQSKSIVCTTAAVSSLSDRAQEAIDTALQATHLLIKDVIQDIRNNHLNDLHAFVDSISLMDMLCSFTWIAHASSEPFCRPLITSQSESYRDTKPILVLENSRHPIVSELSIGSKFVDNSVVVNFNESHVQIVTGINGCGKSTFIKQVALIFIMAQVGCFVPCVSATIPLRDRLFSRLSNQDDLENNLSTFQLEMKELAYILDNVTDNSLVIIDELGRGSSTLDGMSLAFAVVEYFANRESALVLFSTHFHQITELEGYYKGIKTVHLKCSSPRCSEKENQAPSAFASHKLFLGPLDCEVGYGIAMAEQLSLEEEMIKDAKRLQSVLCAKLQVSSSKHNKSSNGRNDVQRLIFKALLRHFALLKRECEFGNVDSAKCRRFLIWLQDILPCKKDLLLANLVH